MFTNSILNAFKLHTYIRVQKAIDNKSFLKPLLIDDQKSSIVLVKRVRQRRSQNEPHFREVPTESPALVTFVDVSVVPYSYS